MPAEPPVPLARQPAPGRSEPGPSRTGGTGRGARPLHSPPPAWGGSCSPQGYVLSMVSSHSQEGGPPSSEGRRNIIGMCCTNCLKARPYGSDKRDQGDVGDLAAAALQQEPGAWRGLQDAAPQGHGHGHSHGRAAG